MLGTFTQPGHRALWIATALGAGLGLNVAVSTEADEVRSAYQRATSGSEAESPTSTPRSTANASPSRTPLKPHRLSPRGASSPTKSTGSAASTPTEALAKVGGALAAVLGLFFAVAWLSKRVQPLANGQLPKEAVEVLGRAPLSGQQSLQLVRVGAKLVLLSVSPTESVALTEVTDPEEVLRLLELCQRQRPGSSTRTFQEELRALSREPSPRGFVDEVESPSRAANQPTSTSGGLRARIQRAAV